MNSGLVAFIFGLLALISAWVMGKAKGKEETTTKISGEITIQKQKAVQAEKEAEMVKDSTPIVTETVREQALAEAEYEQTIESLTKAHDRNDRDTMLEIAKALAQKAISKGASK